MNHESQESKQANECTHPHRSGGRIMYGKCDHCGEYVGSDSHTNNTIHCIEHGKNRPGESSQPIERTQEIESIIRGALLKAEMQVRNYGGTHCSEEWDGLAAETAKKISGLAQPIANPIPNSIEEIAEDIVDTWKKSKGEFHKGLKQRIAAALSKIQLETYAKSTAVVIDLRGENERLAKEVEAVKSDYVKMYDKRNEADEHFEQLNIENLTLKFRIKELEAEGVIAQENYDRVNAQNLKYHDCILDLEAKLQAAEKERDTYAELAAGKCTIHKVTDLLGQHTLVSSKKYSQLESEVTLLKQLLRSSNHDPAIWQGKLKLVEDEVTRLRQALEKYGRCTAECMSDDSWHCWCGFEAALGKDGQV